MLYLLIISLFIFLFLYLSLYIDVVFFFGFTGAIIIFFLILIRVYYLKIISLTLLDKKKANIKESAEDHPIIKSARSRLKK